LAFCKKMSILFFFNKKQLMPLDQNLLKQLIDFRHRLHRTPELSGYEIATSKAIINILSTTKPNKIITNIGGLGVAAIYDSGKKGHTVLFRADMDALPIQESNEFDYRSSVEGVAHLCGHDGHSTILVGLGFQLKENPPKTGKVVLLFQPAEETGQGAAAVIADDKFSEILPDFVYAIHNLPGFNKGEIYIKDGPFASASTGMIVNLKGLSSHAAHPEDGKNPDKAMAQIIMRLNTLCHENEYKDFTMLTVIHAKLGEVAFGTTPGNAVIMATLRSYLDSDMWLMKKQSEDLVKGISKEHGMINDISYTEEFPATINSKECNSAIQIAARDLKLPIHFLETPFRWSEDFGHFTKNTKAALLGIGSGIEHPQLHNEDYDFSDEIIEPAILLFEKIIHNYN